jgi:hypothetical protein
MMAKMMGVQYDHTKLLEAVPAKPKVSVRPKVARAVQTAPAKVERPKKYNFKDLFK